MPQSEESEKFGEEQLAARLEHGHRDALRRLQGRVKLNIPLIGRDRSRNPGSVTIRFEFEEVVIFTAFFPGRNGIFESALIFASGTLESKPPFGAPLHVCRATNGIGFRPAGHDPELRNRFSV